MTWRFIQIRVSADEHKEIERAVHLVSEESGFKVSATAFAKKAVVTASRAMIAAESRKNEEKS